MDVRPIQPIQPIRTEADYKAMLAEVSQLIDLDPPRGTPEGERLGAWAAEGIEAKRAKNEDSVVIPTSP